ncbi:hypothetical protein QVD17_38072 [Tagetes erecta]|uniref:Uncharacterized protein n=1 Tax=Tagetes erecta TaxID=13708 RepID=A0AAD8JZI6_TARER|nr:hypothetical protein QVD17_38072 [Tagetes erecta]
MPDFARVLTFQFAAQFMVTTFQTYANFARVLKFQTSRMIIVVRSQLKTSSFQIVSSGGSQQARLSAVYTVAEKHWWLACKGGEVKPAADVAYYYDLYESESVCVNVLFVYEYVYEYVNVYVVVAAAVLCVCVVFAVYVVYD